MAQKLVVPVSFAIHLGSEATREEHFTQSLIKLGRDSRCHLRIEDASVSRMHCVVEATEEGVQVIDLGAGIQVNGQSVSRAMLQTNDELRIGAVRLVVKLGAAATALPVAPKASEVSVPVPSAQAPVSAKPIETGSIPAMTQTTKSSTEKTTPTDAELYQLIKRSELNPRELEDAGVHAVEVSVLWRSSILHVAHLDGTKDFFLTPELSKKAPTAATLAASLVTGSAAIVGAIATGNYAAGAIGTALLLGGAGASIHLDQKEVARQADVSRFIVGEELLGGGKDVPVVLNRQGRTRFVFSNQSTGEVEIDGVRRSLQEAVLAGLAVPCAEVPDAHAFEMRPGSRYRLELGSLTIVGKVVARGRHVSRAARRDPILAASLGGAGVFVAALIAAMKLASNNANDYLSQNDEEAVLNDLRDLVQHHQDRQQPPPEQQENQEAANAGGTGARAAGESGSMGNRASTQRNHAYAIRNRNETPHLAAALAQQRAQTAGILSAFSGIAVGGSTSGITSPWGQATESGDNDRDANGNLHGPDYGDATGNGGLGPLGTGFGGGGTSLVGVGMGNFGVLGHGNGTGQGDGDGPGGALSTRLPGRETARPHIITGPVGTSGGLTQDAIRRVVRSNIGQVEHCHSLGLSQNPSLAGQVNVSFAIGPDGRVMGSSVAGNTTGNPTVAGCIAAAVRRWHFQQPDGGVVVRVSYPFRLTVD